MSLGNMFWGVVFVGLIFKEGFVVQEVCEEWDIAKKGKCYGEVSEKNPRGSRNHSCAGAEVRVLGLFSYGRTFRAGGYPLSDRNLQKTMVAWCTYTRGFHQSRQVGVPPKARSAARCSRSLKVRF